MKFLLLFLWCAVPLVKGWGRSSDKVLLKDVNVLTLKQGQMTTGRRSQPVPQLKCVGGTAAGQFNPKVVQCYNRGSDGVDVQWECKTDMDNAYRFGQIQVICEGYDYPEDPYILKGSCGLEYTIDLTQEGYEKSNRNGGGYYGGGHSNYHGGGNHYNRKSSHYSSGDIIMMVIIGGLVYLIYRTCSRASTHHTTTDYHADSPPSYQDATGYPSAPSAPPPPGFRPEYTQGEGSQPPGQGGCHYKNHQGQSTHGTHTSSSSSSSTSSDDGPGFWSGAATGGILGYLFGSRNSYANTHYHAHPRYTHHNRGWFSGWGGDTGSSWWGSSPGYGTGGGGGWFSGWGGGNSSSGWGGSARRDNSGSSGWFSGSSSSSGRSSSGTRTASGFGGTSRR